MFIKLLIIIFLCFQKQFLEEKYLIIMNIDNDRTLWNFWGYLMNLTSLENGLNHVLPLFFYFFIENIWYENWIENYVKKAK